MLVPHCGAPRHAAPRCRLLIRKTSKQKGLTLAVVVQRSSNKLNESWQTLKSTKSCDSKFETNLEQTSTSFRLPVTPLFAPQVSFFDSFLSLTNLL
jgi:hypothetical protein